MYAILPKILTTEKTKMSFTTFFQSQWPWFILLGAMVLILLILEYIEKGHGLKVLSMQEGIRLLNDRKACHFDLRTPEEFNQGHIANTQNTPSDTLEKNPETLIKKKDTPVLLICEHNYQASKIGKKLKKQGYSNIHILIGGLSTWRKENLPLETNNG